MIDVPTRDPVRAFVLTFRDQAIAQLALRGRPCWLLPDIERALGYAPRALATLTQGPWASEFVAGRDYDLIRGADLRDLKTVAALINSQLISANTPAITVVYEAGLDLIVLRTDKAIGRELRAYLVEQGLPRLRGAQAAPPLLPPKTVALPAAVSPELIALQQMIGQMAVLEQRNVALVAEQRRLADEQVAAAAHQQALAARQQALAAEQQASAARLDRAAGWASRTTRDVVEQAERLAAVEAEVRAVPGGTSAYQLAYEAGWLSDTEQPHNGAVILACANAGFVQDGRMFRRSVMGPRNRPVLEWVFTTRGVADFYVEVHAALPVGVRTTIAPNAVAKGNEMYRRYHVTRRPPGAPPATPPSK